MTVPTDVLICVEDPGAANMAAGLPEALAARGLSAVLLAAGGGVVQLDRLAIPYVPLPDNDDPSWIIDRHRPRVVVAGTSENRDAMALALVDVARSRCIATVGLVDGPANAAERFRGRAGRPDAHAPDIIALADTASRDALLAAGFAATRLAVAGHPAFDRARAERRRLAAAGRPAVRTAVLPGAAGARPVVVLLSELSDGLDSGRFGVGDGDTLRGAAGVTDRTGIGLDAVIAAVATMTPKPLLVLRLHPKERREDHAARLHRIDLLSSEGPPFAVMFAADLVVGLTTFALVEALLLGRPALSVLPRAADAAWLPAIGQGLIPMVCRNEDIVPAIRRTMAATPDPAQLALHMPEGGAERLAGLIAGRAAIAAGAA